MMQLYRRLKESDIRLVAGSLAFSTVLSLIPFLAVTLAVFQSIGGLEFLVPKIQSLFFRYFREALGAEFLNFIRSILKRINPQTLGTTAAVLLVFTSFRLLQDIEYGINRMWKRDPSRPLHKRMAIAWALMLLIPVLLAIYAGFRSLEVLRPLFRVYRDWSDGIVATLGVFIMYKFIPEVKVEAKKAFYGAVIAGLSLIALEKSFKVITKSFFNVSKVYGSVAMIPLFLIYILIVWYIILLGAAFVASLHKPVKLAP